MKKILILGLLFLICFSLFLFFFRKKEFSQKNSWNNNQEKIPYFHEELLSRYQCYQKKYPNKQKKEIILEVNIGLDFPFYTNISSAINLHTPYILVNKYHQLDASYVPKNLTALNSGVKLVEEAAVSFTHMSNHALEKGYRIIGFSGYRSYEYQQQLYQKYVNIDGAEKADTYSARAGFSEHQTGLAIDIYNGSVPYMQFEQTKEFLWMQQNAHQFGFILRYPKEKENITGYRYEAWHYRYVGIEIATYLKNFGITFDEYCAMMDTN